MTDSPTHTGVTKHVVVVPSSINMVSVLGPGDAVLLSPEAFDSLSAKAEIAEDIAAVERGMQDVRAGRVQDFRQAIRGIADRLGLKIEG